MKRLEKESNRVTPSTAIFCVSYIDIGRTYRDKKLCHRKSFHFYVPTFYVNCLLCIVS